MIAGVGLRSVAIECRPALYGTAHRVVKLMPVRTQTGTLQRTIHSISRTAQKSPTLLGNPGLSYGSGPLSKQHRFAAASSRSLSLWPFASKSNEQQSVTETVQQSASDDAAPISMSDIAPSSTTLPESNDFANEAQDAFAHATEHVQTLAEMGQISNWANVRAVQSLMDWLVEATGMPWWLTIAAVTLSVRIVVLPLVLYGQKNAIRMANIQPRMQAHMADLNHAKSVGDKQLLVRSVESVQKLMKDNDCHPLRSFVAPIVQAPLFMTFFFALRGLGEAGLPTMKAGGLAWFTDLTLADPYYILPVLSSLTMLATLETGAEMGAAPGAEQTQQQITMRWVMRFVLVAAVPFISWMPAAVFCYWITNGFISLLQLWALNRRSVRRMLNLPQQIQHSKEDLRIKERAGSKPMKFWDAVSTGMTSQQDPATVRVIRRDQAPSALKGLNEGRERALDRLQAGGSGDNKRSKK